MKNNILPFVLLLQALFLSPGIKSQPGKGLTREAMILKGKVKTMKYSCYEGSFKEGAFNKTGKSASYHDSRPCVFTVFDTIGHVIEESDYNIEDECRKKITYWYNKQGILLSKQQFAINTGRIDEWHLTYNKTNRLVEHRQYSTDMYGDDKLKPGQRYFERGQFVLGATYHYQDNGSLIELQNIYKRWPAKSFFRYNSSGSLEEEIPGQDWRKVTFIYDSLGRIKKEEYFMHELCSKSEYNYADKGYLSKKTVYDKDVNKRGILKFKYANEYNENGQILKRCEAGFGSDPVSCMIYEYNKQGDILTVIKSKSGKVIEQVDYEYVYDKFDNWIGRYKYVKSENRNRTCRYFEERIFEYY